MNVFCGQKRQKKIHSNQPSQRCTALKCKQQNLKNRTYFIQFLRFCCLHFDTVHRWLGWLLEWYFLGPKTAKKHSFKSTKPTMHCIKMQATKVQKSNKIFCIIFQHCTHLKQYMRTSQAQLCTTIAPTGRQSWHLLSPKHETGTGGVKGGWVTSPRDSITYSFLIGPHCAVKSNWKRLKYFDWSKFSKVVGNAVFWLVDIIDQSKLVNFLEANVTEPYIGFWLDNEFSLDFWLVLQCLAQNFHRFRHSDWLMKDTAMQFQQLEHPI